MENGPFIEVYPWNMVIFHGYVKEPDGNIPKFGMIKKEPLVNGMGWWHVGLGPHILVSCNIKYPQTETLVQYWIWVCLEIVYP